MNEIDKSLCTSACYISNVYGYDSACNIYYLHKYCPCTTCLVKTMCVEKCEEIRKFINKYSRESKHLEVSLTERNKNER